MKLFVAASRRRRACGTMGASNYTYAEAVASKDSALAHVRMFDFLGGVPKAVVPDNLKSAVIKADRFDPGLNRTYAEMAAHYGTAILPALPRKPRDKAKVEVAVQVAQRWMSRSKTRLRHWGASAEPSVLLSGRVERRDPAALGRVEHAPHARIWRQRGRSLCHFGPAQPAAAAGRALCLRQMEARPRGPGLPRRSRQFLVFRPLCPDQTRGRRSGLWTGRRDIPSRSAGCEPCACLRPAWSCHSFQIHRADHMPSAHRRFGEWTPGFQIGPECWPKRPRPARPWSPFARW